MAALDGQARSASVRAHSASRVLMIPAGSFREFLRSRPDLLEQLFWLQVERVRSLTWRVSRTHHKAITDPLTGLYNYGFFRERLALELERAQHTGDPVALAMFDIDHFKHYNDSHGHQEGNRVLQKVAELLRHTASRNVNEEVEDRRTTVQKMADGIAAFSGSIEFLLLHVVFFFVWIILNVDWIERFDSPLLARFTSFDPFPFGLLTMAVSLEAIVLSVFVLLSQHRQAVKERIRADIEYDVNLKAELEIAHLHEKVDHLNAELGRRLERIERGVARGPAA